LQNVTSVAHYLWTARYDVLHVESGARLKDPAQLPVATRGHLYCT
jgi:hypothetical protein